MNVALEMAYPKCAIIRLKDSDLRRNHMAFSALQEGLIYGGKVWEGRGGNVRGGVLTAGSRAEGLAMEKDWGHPEPDQDTMLLYGGPLGVHVPGGRQLPMVPFALQLSDGLVQLGLPSVAKDATGSILLVYRPDDCPPAFCKVQVTDPQALIEVEVFATRRLDAGCIHNSKGEDWLHTNNLLRLLQRGNDITGPVGGSEEFEWAPTLVCSAAHPKMDQKYVNRPRHGWPSPDQLKTILQLPMMLVLVGHKLSDEFHLQARLSWSHSEIWLITKLPETIRQVYIAAKYTFKSLMKKSRDQNSHNAGDGRSNVGSFHLKTSFLWNLEKRPPKMIQSQLRFMLDLLHDFDHYLKAGKLPHYFLPDCNLLETTGPEERRIARSVIKIILSDPIQAILTSPSCPKELYGEAQPNTLVNAFHKVSLQPTCARSHENLFSLLACLDESRKQRYREQLVRDNDRFDWHCVSGRPELIGLANMLTPKHKE